MKVFAKIQYKKVKLPGISYCQACNAQLEQKSRKKYCENCLYIECEYCSKLIHRKGYTFHIKGHISELKKAEVIIKTACQFCNKSFKQQKALQKHELKCNTPGTIEYETRERLQRRQTKGFLCQYCQLQCLTYESTVYHEKHLCSQNPNCLPIIRTKKHFEKVQCQHCGKLISYTKLDKHISACLDPNSKRNKAESKKKYSNTLVACPGCGRQFKQKTLPKHLQSCNVQRERERRKIKYNREHPNLLQCQYCGQLFKYKGDVVKHEKACSNPNSRLNKERQKRSQYNTDLTCKYCGKQCNSYKHLAYHQSVICKNNPNISDELRLKVCHPNSNKVQKGFKYGWYKNIPCDSSWELAFVVYNLDHKIDIKRNHDVFYYIFDDTQHFYLPDFIINNIYYEIKGWWTDQVQAKVDQFTQKLEIIDSKTIQPYLEYAQSTYGNNFTEILYDRTKKSYLDLQKSKEEQ